jgi:subtilisin-like proprotein convertase family protein
VDEEVPNTAPGGDALTPLGGTDFLPMPVLFIGNSGGEGLRAASAANPELRARLGLRTADRAFRVESPLLCEHVGIRLRTDHPLRGDLRITLVSPAGTRSVLQRYNGDLTPGPADWTYWSTHHLAESSLGTWTLSVSDQYADAVGSILEATLVLVGVPMVDSDADGLDDSWELTAFGSLTQGPKDDPDDDGLSNAREQLTGTNPGVAELRLEVDLTFWTSNVLRLSWPGRPARTYEVWAADDRLEWSLIGEVPAQIPETEWFGPLPAASVHLFQVRAR